MSEKYIKSDQINVYPTTTRDDDLDRNSRLQSEQSPWGISFANIFAISSIFIFIILSYLLIGTYKTSYFSP